MGKNYLTVMGITLSLTAWTAMGYYAHASQETQYTYYDIYIEQINEKLNTYTEKRYQKKLAEARAKAQKAYEEELVRKRAQELAIQKAEAKRQKEIQQERRRIQAQKIVQEKKRQEIQARNALIDARETAIQALGQIGGNIDTYEFIPKQSLPTNNTTRTSSQLPDTITTQRKKIEAQRKVALEKAEQNRIAEQKRKEALARAKAELAAQQQRAAAQARRRSRRSHAS